MEISDGKINRTCYTCIIRGKLQTNILSDVDRKVGSLKFIPVMNSDCDLCSPCFTCGLVTLVSTDGVVKFEVDRVIDGDEGNASSAAGLVLEVKPLVVEALEAVKGLTVLLRKQLSQTRCLSDL